MVSSQVPDVQMIFESDVQAIDAQHASIPIILLCNNFVSALHLQKQLDVKFGDRRIQCIAQPYGPIRLSKAMKSATQPAAVEDEGVDFRCSAEEESLQRINGFTITHRSRTLPSSNSATSTPMQSPKTVSASEGLQGGSHRAVIQAEYGPMNVQLSTDSRAVERKEMTGEMSSLHLTATVASGGAFDPVGAQIVQDGKAPLSLLLVDDNVRRVQNPYSNPSTDANAGDQSPSVGCVR